MSPKDFAQFKRNRTDAGATLYARRKAVQVSASDFTELTNGKILGSRVLNYEFGDVALEDWELQWIEEILDRYERQGRRAAKPEWWPGLD